MLCWSQQLLRDHPSGQMQGHIQHELHEENYYFHLGRFSTARGAGSPHSGQTSVKTILSN